MNEYFIVQVQINYEVIVCIQCEVIIQEHQIRLFQRTRLQILPQKCPQMDRLSIFGTTTRYTQEANYFEAKLVLLLSSILSLSDEMLDSTQKKAFKESIFPIDYQVLLTL
jgi:hypothetical protein